jgi:acylphosphatase
MKLHALVKGRVQGVGFRYFVLHRAQELGLDGWVKNLPDGRVKIEASGSPEALDRLERLLWDGPAGARVASVRADRTEGEPDGSGFRVEFF